MKIARTGIKIDNLINKKYRFMKKVRNNSLAFASVNLSFAFADALSNRSFLAILMGASGLLLLKSFENAVNQMLMLKPEYQEIKSRAKNIDKIRKLNTTI